MNQQDRVLHEAIATRPPLEVDDYRHQPALSTGDSTPSPTITSALEPPRTLTPLELLSLAIQRGDNLAALSTLMELQERYVREEAKKAFTKDMAAFKAENVLVTKDRINPQYKSRYVSLGHLVRIVTPYLSKHNLSASWTLDTSSSKIKVTCFLTHSLGHSESVSMDAPPDNSGSKNPIQQSKSAITYLKGCTFESICGLAATDANLDDDGNGFASSGDSLPEQDYQRFLDAIQAATTLASLEEAWRSAMTSTKSQRDQKEFIHAKNEMKQRLGGGQ